MKNKTIHLFIFVCFAIIFGVYIVVRLFQREEVSFLLIIGSLLIIDTFRRILIYLIKNNKND